MLVIDKNKRDAGHYAGILEWLEHNIGYDGAQWHTELDPARVFSDRMVVRAIIFKDPAHETLATLVWG